MRYNIRHVMIVAAFVAIGLAALREFDQPRSLIGQWLSLGALLLLVFLMVGPFVWPHPLRVALTELPEDPDEAIEALEHGLASWRPMSLEPIIKARRLLMALYRQRGRYEEAIVQGRLILVEMPGLHPTEKHEIRQEIAACEALLAEQ